MPCRTDNGLCLVRLAKPAGESWAVIQFSDGKVYRVVPVTDSDFAAIPTRANQPGCWFNEDLKLRPGYSYARLPFFPVIPSTGWLSILL